MSCMSNANLGLCEVGLVRWASSFCMQQAVLCFSLHHTSTAKTTWLTLLRHGMHLGSALASRTARLMKGIKCNPSVMSIAGFHKERKKVRKGLCLPVFTGEKPKGKAYWVSLGSVRNPASGVITVVVSLFQPLLRLLCGSCCFLGFHTHLQCVLQQAQRRYDY